jgi:hypothetical protein
MPRPVSIHASRSRPRPARFTAAALTAALVALAALPACAPYVTYPSDEAGRYAEGDVNAFPAPTVCRLALNRVIAIDRGEGVLDGDETLLINPPRGTSRRAAQKVAEGVARQSDVDVKLVGDAGFENATIYAITRLWLRGDEARVDIVRPVDASHDEGDVWRRTTVRLRGGVRPWTVRSVQDWPRGLANEPELFGWPEQPSFQLDDDGMTDDDAPAASNVAR